MLKLTWCLSPPLFNWHSCYTERMTNSLCLRECLLNSLNRECNPNLLSTQKHTHKHTGGLSPSGSSIRPLEASLPASFLRALFPWLPLAERLGSLGLPTTDTHFISLHFGGHSSLNLLYCPTPCSLRMWRPCFRNIGVWNPNQGSQAAALAVLWTAHAEGGRGNAPARLRQVGAALVTHPAPLLLNFQPQRSWKSLRPQLTCANVSLSFQQLYFSFHVLYACILSQPLLASEQTSFALSWHAAFPSHRFPPVQGWINPCWTRTMLYHSSKD